ncbi:MULTISPECIES: methionine synthase [unclassified Aeromicrobium]|uniref:methionine synthase n=1 Tax=unclassified Aeromicrobium TaxID=2633570 RepID=UPI002097B1CD|nr:MULTISPECIES: methionine synthase [unclassified Aeromicrobium]MCO7239538.1 methionine synthase [Aeromicrobium sp. CnD17-E]MDR6119926.1 methionine synthase II (cobalamin-independent) [Aeromicrobium sp. SORGH_AS_0981]
MRATGIGSLPGEDYAESAAMVLGTLDDLVFVPELPARGVAAQMVGRSLAVLDGLGADLQPAGWRLLDASGVDHRRARSLLAQDLDVLEEVAQDREGTVKQQVAGPWTLAATVELQRGEKVLSDHGARRDLAHALASGVADHVASLRRRFPRSPLVLQVDEPALPAVLAAQVPTSSGFGRYRTVDLPEADALLRLVVDAVRDAGATPVVHCCAPAVPVSLLHGVGFDAIAFDLGLVEAATGGGADAWAEAFEAGTDLWVGALPSTDVAFDPAASRRRIEDWTGRLGFGEDAWHDRVVVTPACGLAGASPAFARRVLAEAVGLAR